MSSTVSLQEDRIITSKSQILHLQVTQWPYQHLDTITVVPDMMQDQKRSQIRDQE